MALRKLQKFLWGHYCRVQQRLLEVEVLRIVAAENYVRAVHRLVCGYAAIRLLCEFLVLQADRTCFLQSFKRAIWGAF